MVSRIAKLLLLGISLVSTTQAVVIVTHGFNANHTDWYKPGGDFYETLKKTAAYHGHSIKHFGWQQKYLGYSYGEHVAAGAFLAQEIIEFCHRYSYKPAYPNDHEIIIVAHSYGGLVSYHASQTLAAFLAQIEQKEKDYYRRFFAWFKKSWAYLAKTWSTQMPDPVISRLCTLGTPHLEYDVIPSPQGVKKIYNLYSTADWVAYEPVAGKPLLPNSLLNKHKGAFNIQMLGSTNEIIHGFSHSEMHHPAIAEHIFNIMQTCDVASKQKPAPQNMPYTAVIPEAKLDAIPAKKMKSSSKTITPLPELKPRATLLSAGPA